jgi:hypothetical protein
MLGTPDNDPSLLVLVEDDFDPADFDFEVINGRWEGKFTNGHISVFGCPSGDWSDLGVTHILSEDQHRLRGKDSWDYQTVFDNWDNPNYVGPEWITPHWPDMDDDIAF